MERVLWSIFRVKAVTLHDRPASMFQPLSPEQRKSVLERLPETKEHAVDLQQGKWRLIVSSTSWTADEDFSLLLEALENYSSSVQKESSLPDILAIITGKGPQKEYYLEKIRALNQQKKLESVLVNTAWLAPDDYAALLGAADLGISLHTSSSGVDLPMKVVDMFGAGLPVLGWGEFEAWPELVRDGVNGRSFASVTELQWLLEEVLGGDGSQLKMLREGALKESAIRWDDEWDEVAGRLFNLTNG